MRSDLSTWNPAIPFAVLLVLCAAVPATSQVNRTQWKIKYADRWRCQSTVDLVVTDGRALAGKKQELEAIVAQANLDLPKQCPNLKLRSITLLTEDNYRIAEAALVARGWMVTLYQLRPLQNARASPPRSPGSSRPPAARPVRPATPAVPPAAVNAAKGGTTQQQTNSQRAPAKPATAAAGKPVQGGQTNVQSSNPGEVPSSRLASDPRLAQLTPENRTFALNEVDGAVPYCNNNPTLSAIYDCGCFARGIFDARLRAGFQTAQGGRGTIVIEPQFTKLVMDTSTGKYDISKCISPPALESYGREWSKRVIPPVLHYSEEKKARIVACVGPLVAAGYQAKPVPDIHYLQDLVVKAIPVCEKRNP